MVDWERGSPDLGKEAMLEVGVMVQELDGSKGLTIPILIDVTDSESRCIWRKTR
jgi:hypothetical protein